MIRSALSTFAVAATFVPLAAADAQRPSIPAIALRPFAGAFVPTGDQRDVLGDAAFIGAQLGLAVHPNLTLVGSFGWAPSEDLARSSLNTVDLYQYDFGAELATSRPLGEMWSFKPFVGAGVGGRTYSYRDLDVDTETDFVGYGALGAEFQRGRFAFRLEGRDYVSSFSGLDGSGASSTRNDLTFAAGITVNLR